MIPKFHFLFELLPFIKTKLFISDENTIISALANAFQML